MANRSMSFAASAIPDGKAKQDIETIGLSEYSYTVPVIYKLLVSCSPQLCRSCVFKKTARLAIIGDAKEGVVKLEKLAKQLPNTSLILPLIEEALSFLAREYNQYPYYLLEPAEVSAMSGKPLPAQMKVLMNEVLALDLASLKDTEVQQWASKCWSNILYYTPRSAVEPPVHVNKSYLRISAEDLLALADDLEGATKLQTVSLEFQGSHSSLATCLEALRAVPQPFTLVIQDLQGELPDVFPSLEMLEGLRLCKLELGDFPSCLSNLTGLKTIDLAENNFSNLPQVLRKLTTLQNIHVANNALRALPEWIGELTHLKILDVRNCGLTEVPDNLWTLSELASLNLSRNHIGTLPSSIGKLQKLTRLALYDTRVRSFPREFWTLSCLESLFLGGNALANDAFSGLGALRSLHKLQMAECELETLPTELCKLPALKRLEVRKNNLETIPDCVRNLELDYIGLRKNPLKLTQSDFRSKAVGID